LPYNTISETITNSPMILPGKYQQLHESFPQLNNNDMIDYCQFLLDTEQHVENDDRNRMCHYLLSEGLLYHVPINNGVAI